MATVLLARRRCAVAGLHASTAASRPTSKAELRAAVARTTVDDWIPTYTLQDGADAQVSRGRLVECADLARPETFSGLDTVAVSSFDMGSALQSRQTVGVVAGGQQIYATDASTYVSTTEWNAATVHRPERACTSSSRPRPARAATKGRARFPGRCSTSTRCRSTRGCCGSRARSPNAAAGSHARQVTEGMVTTLQEQDGTLRQLGQVGGLGREDNESIRRGAVHRGARVRRDVPADGSALRSRPPRSRLPRRSWAS